MPNIFSNSRIRFNQLIADTREYLKRRYGQSENTYTPASPFGQIMTVVHGLAQKIFYYIEDSITELNINTASREASVKGLVSLTGYQPNNARSAKGNIRITYNGTVPDDQTVFQIIVPNYTAVYSRYNNLPYVIQMSSDVTFKVGSAESTVDARIIQGDLFERVFTGNGSNVQTFRINERNSDYIDMDTIRVYVNGEEFPRYFSIYDMPLGKPGYMVRTSVGGGLDIVFGTIRNGFIPPSGSQIRVEGIKTIGFLGNVLEAANMKLEFTDPGYDNFGEEIDLNEFVDITPTSEIVFGSNPESVEITKISAPKHSRAFVLSSPEAYESYIRRMNYFSTVDIFNTFDDNDLTDDNVVYMFLIPNLSFRVDPKYNYFTAPDYSYVMSSDEKTELLNSIRGSGRMMLGTELEIIDPIIKRFTLSVVVDYFEGYSKDIIRTSIIDSLSSYFINYTRRDRIPKSDLIAIIENISGVDSVNVFYTQDPNNFNTGSDTYINDMGDIIIGKRDYPIIRGGWINDSTGVEYLEGIDDENPSALNISFEREVPKDINRSNNKQIVRGIRNGNI